MQISSTITFFQRRKQEKRNMIDDSNYRLNEAFYTLELLERLHNEWQHANGLVITQRVAIKKLEMYQDACMYALAWCDDDNHWVDARLKRYRRHLSSLELQAELAKMHYEKVHKQYSQQLKNIKDNH